MTDGDAARHREKARNRALLLLEHRERSVREMRQRLARAGFEPEVVEEVVVWLLGIGYLDDQRFACSYAASKRRSGWGPVRIQRELALKGVAPSLVEAALQATPPGREGGGGVGEDAEDVLVASLRRKFAEAFRQDARGTRRRAAAYLARRGHPWPDIQRLLGRSLGSEGVEDEGDVPSS